MTKPLIALGLSACTLLGSSAAFAATSIDLDAARAAYQQKIASGDDCPMVPVKTITHPERDYTTLCTDADTPSNERGEPTAPFAFARRSHLRAKHVVSEVEQPIALRRIDPRDRKSGRLIRKEALRQVMLSRLRQGLI